MSLLLLFLFPFVPTNTQLTEEKNFTIVEQCLYWDGRSTDSLIYYSNQLHAESSGALAPYIEYIKGRSVKDDSIAYEFLSSAFQMASEINNPHLMARATYRIGRIISKTEQYDSALHWYHVAQELLSRRFEHPLSDASRQSALIHTSQAFVSIRLNNYEKAIDHSLMSLKLSEIGGYDELKLVSLLNLSAAYGEYHRKDMATGDRLMELSKRYMFQAAVLAEELNDIRRASRTYGNIAIYYEQAGNLDSAKFFLTKAIEKAKEVNDTYGLVNLYNSLSINHMIELEPDSARFYIDLAINHAENLGQELLRADVMLTLADVQHYKGDFSGAQNTLKEALTITKEMHAPRLTAAGYSKLYKISEEKGLVKEALSYYQTYISYRDSVVSLDNLNRIEELKAQHETEKKERQIENLEQEQMITQLQIRQQNALLVGGTILVFVLSLVGYVFYRNRTLRLGQQRLIIEQQLLRSQINPHFLFNALSSIHAYVYEGNKREASDYLATFAELTRDVLDQSSVDWIPLKKELKTLQQYIEIQQLRFPHVVSELVLSEELQEEETYVPSMILQPFIENAFEHGLSHQSEGSISIRIGLLEDNRVTFEIEDDGVGLSATPSQHRSQAIIITKKRLNLLYGRKNFELQVLNRKDSSGVRVTMVLPFKALI